MSEPKHLDLTSKEVKELLDDIDNSNLPEEQRQKLKDIVIAMLWMGRKLEDKDLTISRLRRLFGIKTEKAENLGLKDKNNDDDKNGEGPAAGGQETSREAKNSNEESKPKGHNGGDDYPDAERISVDHESLKPGDTCPECGRGKLYEFGVGCVVRLIGQAPIKAKIYEPQQLRCSTCLAFYTAALPPDVSESRADPTAKSIAVIFRYGSGIPFYRNEKLQDIFNTPVPDSTQWDWAEDVLNDVYPVFGRLQVWGAQGELFFADDTGMRIVQLKKRLTKENAERTGIYTSGIISHVFGHEVALFFTGNRHAGENLGAVLEKRCPTARPPKLMCDALASNTALARISH